MTCPAGSLTFRVPHVVVHFNLYAMQGDQAPAMQDAGGLAIEKLNSEGIYMETETQDTYYRVNRQ